MKAVGYCRFSSDMQRDGYSIEAQQQAITKHCTDNGIELLKFYIDEAISGTTDERPAFQQMIEDSKTNDFNLVIVHKLDRFSRNKYDSAIYKKKLKDNNIKLISVLEPLDDSPESVILESLLEGMSEYYSRNLSREVRKGKRVAASKGNRSGKIAFGYTHQDKKIVINEEERPYVEEIFKQRANGVRLQAIFEWCKKQGLNFSRPSTVESIIQNPIYKGSFIYAKKKEYREEFKDVVEPIITEELWAEANNQIKTHDRYRKNENMLSGLLTCGICGSPLNVITNNNHRYYVCNKRKNGAYDQNGRRITLCNNKYYEADKLERTITDNIFNIFKNDTFKDLLYEKLNKVINEDSNEKIIKDIDRELFKVETAKKRLVDLICDGKVDRHIYEEKLKSLNDRKSELYIQKHKSEFKEKFISLSREEISLLIESNSINRYILKPLEIKEFIKNFVKTIAVRCENAKIEYNLANIMVKNYSLNTDSQKNLYN